jgi:hypothetical protein
VWLWQHGGYDVEGPDATLERERLTAQYEAQDTVIKAALDRPGPWPMSSTVRTQNVEIVDVDRYDDLAVVTAAVAEAPGGHGPTLRASVFRWEDGTWKWLGGGGVGSRSDPLFARQESGDNDRGLRVASKGWHGPRQRGGFKPACDAMLWCSPAVSSVRVDRPSHRRVADVGTGPGWIGIVWPEGSEPSVSAFDAAAKQVAVLAPDDLRYNSRSQHWPVGARGRLRFGWRLGRRERGWFNYQPRPRQGQRRR